MQWPCFHLQSMMTFGTLHSNGLMSFQCIMHSALGYSPQHPIIPRYNPGAAWLRQHRLEGSVKEASTNQDAHLNDSFISTVSRGRSASVPTGRMLTENGFRAAAASAKDRFTVARLRLITCRKAIERLDACTLTDCKTSLHP